jgi:hypothetical protein
MTKINICQTQAATAAASVFTATTTTTIDAAVVCNPTGADDNLSVWLVSDGLSQADNNAVYHELLVSAGATVSLTALVNQGLVTGAKIYLQATTSAAALTVTIAGRTG